jgi:hypothetical protein
MNILYKIEHYDINIIFMTIFCSSIKLKSIKYDIANSIKL